MADVPPPSEVVHLPAPSYLPVVVALGVTIALVGILMNVVVVAIGVIIALAAIKRWIGETREDIADLPLEH